MTVVVGIFFYPKATLSLEAVNFTYSRGGLNDSIMNLVSNAYVEQQVFLGKTDDAFLKVLRYIANDSRVGRVAFYSNRSQTVDMFYYYALLPLAEKSTPQGIAPEGEIDPKWSTFTQYIIWQINETLLKLSGTRWVISNYPLVLDSNVSYKVFGRYRLYELADVALIKESESTVHTDIGEIQIVLSQECESITFAETYHPRWRAYNQDGVEVEVLPTEYGFMKIVSSSNFREVHLVYSETTIDILSRIVSVACLIGFVTFSLAIYRGSTWKGFHSHFPT